MNLYEKREHSREFWRRYWGDAYNCEGGLESHGHYHQSVMPVLEYEKVRDFRLYGNLYSYVHRIWFDHSTYIKTTEEQIIKWNDNKKRSCGKTKNLHFIKTEKKIRGIK